MKLISKCGKPKSLLDRKYPREGVKKVRVTEGSGFSVLEAYFQLDVPIGRKTWDKAWNKDIGQVCYLVCISHPSYITFSLIAL